MVAVSLTHAELAHFAHQLTLAALFASCFGMLLGCLRERGQLVQAMGAAVSVPAHWGMGLCPMLDSSHPAFPYQGAGGELGCVSKFGEGLTQAQGDGGRVVKRSEDPRPMGSDQACPFSCLKDKRAEGVPAPRCGHGGGGDSGEVHSTLEELAATPPHPFLSFPSALRCGQGDGGDSVETPSVLEELTPAPSRFFRTV